MDCKVLILMFVLVETCVGREAVMEDGKENPTNQLQLEKQLYRSKRGILDWLLGTSKSSTVTTRPTSIPTGPTTTSAPPKVCKCDNAIVKREAADDDDVEFRIVGGSVTRPHEYPQIGQLTCKKQNGKTGFCACTLINKQHVITAAHCVDELSILTSYPCKVTVGKQYFISEPNTEPNQKTIDVEKITPHPDFDLSTFKADIAVLKLKEKIVTNQDVKPACIPLKRKNFDNLIVIAVGWGRTSEGGPTSKSLQEVDLRVISNQQCKKNYEDRPELIVDDSKLCAGDPEGGKDSCEGDSGGPLFFNSSSPIELICVISNGYGCGRQDKPGIYLRIDSFFDFIFANSKMNDGECEIYSHDSLD